ncbi:MAG: leucyl aminopeptidase family protein [Rhodocyclaceae bacterium]|jgi:leucyl aminopeptidase|nr:leucyl aminopeptidase family protein [Rhodocyclaceae bacterium]
MKLAQLHCHPAFAPARLKVHSHTLLLLPAGKDLPADLPARAQWAAVLARREAKVEELAKTPQALDLAEGGRMALAMIDPAKPRFERLTLLRKAVMQLLEETPREIALIVGGGDLDLARDAVYCAWVNGIALPVTKKKPVRPLAKIHYYGSGIERDFAAVAALARGNGLSRELTALPPNVLTPGDYRRRIGALARSQGWKIDEYDFKRLKKMGAGAFCAVAQGSDHRDAAIVRLSYQPRGAKRRVALVGKGICFDTGGHNLKPARYMQGMHEDMNGSAVVLGLLQALSDMHAPIAVDAWLAIAHNHLSPGAYKQNDIVCALDGTSIEIVHTDAEGRMVLADTLTLAAREKPDLIVDFATLTGSMHAALGSRYSGVFASDEALARAAVAAGRASGERVCVFPMDEDYAPALDSKVADIKQCTMEGEADHILAALFLKRFTAKRPWLHVDLSASSNEGGLGAVAGSLSGFGVAWGLHLLGEWAG